MIIKFQCENCDEVHQIKRSLACKIDFDALPRGWHEIGWHFVRRDYDGDISQGKHIIVCQGCAKVLIHQMHEILPLETKE